MSTADEFDREAVIAIQGGGVYGLGLLGQLSAVIDRHEIRPLALSGSSAGAIIAALYWAGLTPKEIRDRFLGLPSGSGGGGCRSLTDLLGPFGEGRRRLDFDGFRRVAEPVERLLSPPTSPAGPAWLAPYRVVARVFGLARSTLGIWAHLARQGFFGGEQLEETVDRWIRGSRKLEKYKALLEPHPRVTFGLIRRLQRDHPEDADLYFPPLILTATNLSTGRLTLIKSYDDRFGDVPIARAVRASAGFPFFFRPVPMAFRDEGGREVEGRFVDGGVISNFPAWVFSSVLRGELDRYVEFADIARQPWLNIGLRLVADPARGQPPARGPRAGLLKAMFGLLTGQVRDELETSLADRLPRMLPIRQLDTDTSGPGRWNDVHLMTDDKIRAMFARGLDAADDLLRPCSFALPPANHPAIRRAMAGLVDRAARALGHASNAELRLRVNVFIPRRGEHGRELVLRYALNMGRDADRRLRFAYDTGLTGLCFRDRNPWICNLGALREVVAAGRGGPWFGMSAEQHKIVAPDRTWLACVPIFDPLDCRPRAPGPIAPLETSKKYLAVTCPSPTDGAVFGVLGLDANLPYARLGLDPDMKGNLTDPRVGAIITLMQAAALETSFVLAEAFARRGKP